MYQNMYNTPAPQKEFNPYEQNVRILKSFFSKPLFLVIAICGAFSAVLSIITTLVNNSQTNIYDIFGEYGSYLSDFDSIDFINSINSVSIGFTIIVAVYTLLVASGYLLLFLKSKNEDPSSSPKAGATILWVLSIIEMVLFSILAVIMIIFAFVFFIAASSYSSSSYYYYSSVNSAATGIAIAFGCILLILSIVVLFSAISKLRFFSSVHSDFINVNLTSGGSVAFGVFTILGVIGSIITLFSLMASLRTANVSTVLSIISSLVSIVSNICLIMFAFSFNSYIKGFKSGATPIAPKMQNNYTNPYGQPANQGGVQNPANNYNGYNQNNQYGSNSQVNKSEIPVPDKNIGYSYNQNNQANQQPFSSTYENHVNAQYDNRERNSKNAYTNPYYNKQSSGVNANPYSNAQNQNNSQFSSGKCPMCGASCNPNDMFCGECGARIK